MKNKKHCTVLLSLFIACTLIGCNAKTPKQTPDSSTSAVSENDTVVTNVRERGLCFSIAQEYIDKGVILESASENTKGYKNIGIFYYSPTATALLKEANSIAQAELTQEVVMDYLDKISSSVRCLMEVVMVETTQYETGIAGGGKPEDFTYYTPAEVLGTHDGYTYIISVPELDDGTLNDAEAADYHACKDYMQTVRDTLTFIPVESGNVMPSFTTKDINGDEVDSSVFSEKKLTVVNVWGTFCGPCIEEMPELAEWAKEMGDDVQLIGIVGDINGENDTQHIELAQTIAQKANVEFTNLIPNDDLSGFMSNIIGFPTTFFVDQTGALVGEPIIGANVKGCKEFVENYFAGQ